jgi:hypothetical protein
MKRNNIPILDSTLVVKSTASLREEIINDLLRPDQSLSLLLNKEEIKDETQMLKELRDRGSRTN